MKNTQWTLIIKNPLTTEIITTETFRTLKDIHNKYTNIPLTTLRNIGMGRSKIYNKFIDLTKNSIEKNEPIVL